MQRVLSTVTLLGLLVATAAAFAITEHLKLIKSPIFGTNVTSLISPVCGCTTAKATIHVDLRRRDRLTVTIVDASKRTVATLATNVLRTKGPVGFVWDGRTDTGTVAPDGRYRPEIHLANARWTALLPNPITVDTAPPTVLSASVERATFTPGGHRTIAIRYTLAEHAHAAVYLGRQRLILSRPSRPRGAVNWSGRRDHEPLRAGRYVLSVAAVDLAGNVTPPAGRKDVVVVIRSITLSETRVQARPGARFSIGVATRAQSYTWRLAGKHGTGHGSVLKLRAPAKRGGYSLVVTARGQSASARVIVGRR